MSDEKFIVSDDAIAGKMKNIVAIQPCPGDLACKKNRCRKVIDVRDWDGFTTVIYQTNSGRKREVFLRTWRDWCNVCDRLVPHGNHTAKESNGKEEK